MADPVAPVTPVQPAVSSTAPAVVAVVPPAAPAAAPAAPANGAAATDQAPIVSRETPAAPVAEAPAPAAVEPAPITTEKAPSLLSKVEEKPAPAAEAKKPDAEAAPAKPEGPAEPAPAPTYDPFVFPEGLKAGDKEIGQFTTTLGEYELALAKDPTQVHGETQKLGQRLVDMHIAELGKMQKFMQDQQMEAFNRLQEHNVEEFRKDPEIGGNRFDTTLNSALNVIREYAGSDQHLAQLRADLKYTGAANLPSVIRLLNNIGKALSEGKPVAAVRPMPPAAPVSRKNARYAGSIPQKG